MNKTSFSDRIREIYDVSQVCAHLDRIFCDEDISDGWVSLGETSDFILRRLFVSKILFMQQMPLVGYGEYFQKANEGFEEEHADLMEKIAVLDTLFRQRILEVYGEVGYSFRKKYRLFRNPENNLTSIIAWAPKVS